MGVGSRKPYEWWKGRPTKQATAELGEKVHYRVNLKGRRATRSSRHGVLSGKCLENGWINSRGRRRHSESGHVQKSRSASQVGRGRPQ